MFRYGHFNTYKFKVTWTHWRLMLPVRGIWFWIYWSYLSPYLSHPWRNGNMAGCPWQGRFITPQRWSYRAPQGSPSYVGGHRSEVSLYLRCPPPECAINIQAYRFQIALIGVTDGLGVKQKIALAQWRTCSCCRYFIIKVHIERNVPLFIRTSEGSKLTIGQKFPKIFLSQFYAFMNCRLADTIHTGNFL